MTIQEAIRECEGTLERARKLEVEKPGFKLPGHDHYVDFLETLLAAARKGAAEELQTERDELIEEVKELTMGNVVRAIRYLGNVIEDAQRDGVYMMANDKRHLVLYEMPVHTALAALCKVHEDMVAAGVDSVETPNTHIVTVRATGPENMEKILKQVESDLQKIFGEAAKGKA